MGVSYTPLYPFHIILRSTTLTSIGRRSYRRHIVDAISGGLGISPYANCDRTRLRYDRRPASASGAARISQVEVGSNDVREMVLTERFVEEE